MRKVTHFFSYIANFVPKSAYFLSFRMKITPFFIQTSTFSAKMLSDGSKNPFNTNKAGQGCCSAFCLAVNVHAFDRHRHIATDREAADDHGDSTLRSWVHRKRLVWDEAAGMYVKC